MDIPINYGRFCVCTDHKMDLDSMSLKLLFLFFILFFIPLLNKILYIADMLLSWIRFSLLRDRWYVKCMLLLQFPFLHLLCCYTAKFCLVSPCFVLCNRRLTLSNSLLGHLDVLQVPIDSLVVGSQHSAFLQQVPHIIHILYKF